MSQQDDADPYVRHEDTGNDWRGIGWKADAWADPTGSVGTKTKCKFKATTDSKHDMHGAENLLDRQFTAAGPNQAWVSDIAYVWTGEGWLYLAVVIDLHNRDVVGWSMNERIKRDLVIEALISSWRWAGNLPVQGLFITRIAVASMPQATTKSYLPDSSVLCTSIIPFTLLKLTSAA